ncbi:MAG TPA: patatin-like protein [Alphaproteobacteria bacterium]|nr:patatin-like protein [Alphaproteobacteria bacterium]
MREKELRLALVCFGGISLAVYMHGISKEILKLVRASSGLHAIVNRSARAEAVFHGSADPDDPEYDTEAIYFELLRDIGRKVDLRVIVDIIAGASAGGINGTMLARALAHDLPMGSLRDLWLMDADVTELLATEARAKVWSKWFMRPFVWAAARMRTVGAIKDREVRNKLSLFLRSRWFKPPFDGLRMAALMFDAVISMGKPKHPTASLLPSNHQLDLFVTLTDFYGYQQLIQIHDPPLIGEREHRHTLSFQYRRWPNGEVDSDFELENAPALAFAARATSSFPGVFPPAQIQEMEALLKQRGIVWESRDRFIARNFRPYTEAHAKPEATSFVDGAVLNNKPFREAIQAIRGKPAYRQVDRRLVYIDPDPSQPPPPDSHRRPGFFSAIKGSLSDIPRNEPISDELTYVAGFNERVRRLKSIVEAARPQIAKLVAEVATLPSDGPVDVQQIRAWREAVNFRVARDAGFAYEGYVRLKLTTVRIFVSNTIISLCAIPPRSAAARAVAEIVDAWAALSGFTYVERDSHALKEESSSDEGELPSWIKFLLSFDVDFRKRRLNFLVQGQNRLYQMLDDPFCHGMEPTTVDKLKREFYRCLDALRQRENPAAFSTATRQAAAALFTLKPTSHEARQLNVFAERFARENASRIEGLIARLAAEIDLNRTTHDVDALLAGMDTAAWSPAARREVLINYLGFPFWDVLTLSVTNWRDAAEFDEILIDRISPDDAMTFRDAGLVGELRGTAFGHFGAFFSRAYRENDYLWGRLHAIDRLIDIVCDSAEIDASSDGIDVNALKCRAFEILLAREAPHLPLCGEVVARLREEIVKLRAKNATKHPAPTSAAHT